MRYMRGHKEKTRERILIEAAKAIRLNGPDRIGVDSVMARTGLTHGGFYAHFKSKEALITAAVVQMMVEANNQFRQATADRPARKGLEAYFDWYLSSGHRNRVETGCPLPRLSADLMRLDQGSRRAFAEGLAQLTAMISGKLREIDARTPENMATSLLAEALGALAISRAIPDRRYALVILDHSRRSIHSRLAAAVLSETGSCSLP
jgi:TetR/AcrR family transcriptional regulator, transcriptional repressor for nem operon